MARVLNLPYYNWEMHNTLKINVLGCYKCRLVVVISSRDKRIHEISREK